MKRWDIINTYIKKRGYKDYLEIGLQSGMCRDNVIAENKTTVDPDERSNNPTHLMTSDEFFKENKDKYDIIFVDGLHEAPQVLRDIKNAIKVLNEGGVILCHDMLPTLKEVQEVPRQQQVWTGDCWKAWAKLKGTRDDLSMFIVNTDWGVGVIEKGSQEVQKHLDKPLKKYDWSFFCENKVDFDIKSTSEFLEVFRN